MKLDSIKQEFGIEGLVIAISQQDVDSVTTATVQVVFEDALRQAVDALLTDGSLDESPLWVLENVPEEYDLAADATPEMRQAKVRELINLDAPTLRLRTDAESDDDEWQGKIMNGMTGMRYGTANYWIFELVNGAFSDLNYIVVDKSGTQKALCWGAN